MRAIKSFIAGPCAEASSVFLPFDKSAYQHSCGTNGPCHQRLELFKLRSIRVEHDVTFQGNPIRAVSRVRGHTHLGAIELYLEFVQFIESVVIVLDSNGPYLAAAMEERGIP